MAMVRQAAVLLICVSALCAGHRVWAQQPGGEQPTEPRAARPVLAEDLSAATDFGDVTEDSEFPVEQASLLWQQPAAQPAAPSLSTATPRSTRGSRQANVGLASVPNMFGDCGMTTANITILGNGRTTNADFMLPMVGGSRTAKMSENDIAMPVDRVFFNYNHNNSIF